jgi:hypothetical protein
MPAMGEPWSLVALMGAVVWIGAHHLLIFLDRRDEPLHLWVAAWCGDTAVYLVARWLQVAGPEPEWGAVGSRLGWTTALVLGIITIGLAHALAGTRPSRTILSTGLGVTVALIAGLWFSTLVLTRQTYARVDALGNHYVTPVPGPLLALLVVYFVLAAVYGFAIVLRERRLSPSEHRAVVVGFSLYVAFMLNDLLHAARMIQSVRVFQFAFVFVAFGLTWMLARRYNRLTTQLQHDVAERTAQLTALLGAAQSIVKGLDLSSTLARITAEAAQIAHTPHVQVLLLDRATGLLRAVASSGAPMPADFALPLGARYSGIVAATRRPLFIADTQADPQNPLPERARDHRLVTYLGLPILAGDTPLGVLTLNTEDRRTWTDAQLTYLASFADQAAIAITNARRYEAETAARHEAQAALAQVTQLQGLLPICAWCKRVRNDENYWQQIETYVSERSQATFSHGICPDCRRKMEAGR